MVLARRVIALALFLQCSTALIEFEKSKLFDEFDVAVSTIWVSSFCTPGCRIYASIPDSSAEIAKRIIIKDFVQEVKTLYDISKMTNGAEKGYFDVAKGNIQVDINNHNPDNATAPLALWILRNDAENFGPKTAVYDAANLNTAPNYLSKVTVMSVEPFTLRTNSDGMTSVVATLSGFDSLTNLCCPHVIPQTGTVTSLPWSMEAVVQSPLISMDFNDYPNTQTSITAHIGKEKLNFSGLSFVAPPGYTGCQGGKKFRSSLYEATTTVEYINKDRLYNITTNTEKIFTNYANPLKITDKTNDKQFTVTESGKTIRFHNTNNLEISWTSDENDSYQYFLIHITPYREQLITTPIPATTAKPKQLDGNCWTGFLWLQDKTGKWIMENQVDEPYTRVVNIFCTTQLNQPIPSACENFLEDEEEKICYQVGATAESWQDAQMICRDLGANLASIHNPQENSFVRRLAVSRGALNGLFLGATTSGKRDDFGWIDGSEWDYNNFYPGFPKSGFGDCVAMDTSTSSGQWMNRDCTTKLPVACVRKEGVTADTTCREDGSWKEGEVIYSPSFPYDASVPCEYLLMVEEGRSVELEIILLEANDCCDSLKIYDDYMGGNMIANLSGEVRNATYSSGNRFMRVNWQPNGGVNVRGVAMVYRGV